MNEKVAGSASGSALSTKRRYIADSIDELKKVQFPTRQEAMRMTGVVLLIIVVISMCLFFSAVQISHLGLSNLANLVLGDLSNLVLVRRSTRAAGDRG